MKRPAMETDNIFPLAKQIDSCGTVKSDQRIDVTVHSMDIK